MGEGWGFQYICEKMIPTRKLLLLGDVVEGLPAKRLCVPETQLFSGFTGVSLVHAVAVNGKKNILQAWKVLTELHQLSLY